MPDNKGWVVHIASIEIVIGGRLVQRCALCGTKLVDSGRGTKVMVVEENGVISFDPPFKIYEPRSLVAEREGVFKAVNAPDDFYPERGGCVSLLED